MFFIKILFLISVIFFSAQVNFAQAASEKLSLNERAWMASKMYSSVKSYFGHWQGVPDLDLDAEYKKFLEKALASDVRRDFDLAGMEFIAKLKNGHSDFYDSWLSKNFGAPLGFVAAKTPDGKWSVNASSSDTIAVGDELEGIDGQTFEQFYQDKKKYLAGSNEDAQRRALFYRPFLFPESFTLTLNGGKKVSINRRTQKLKQSAPPATEGKMLDGGIAYLKIPSFGEPEFQNKALDFIKQNAGAKAFIIDVRDNGGGTTPSQLIAALMERPYRDWLVSSAATVGLFGAYNQIQKIVPPNALDERQKGQIEAVAEYEQVQIYTVNKIVPPENPIYKGTVVVLTNFNCASACEDFVMPLKTSGRAQIVGQATRGSTGQPYIYEFGNGMGFRVSAKRVFLPDGSPFEGVGLKPDILIEPTSAELRAGKDSVLEKALEIIKNAR